MRLHERDGALRLHDALASEGLALPRGAVVRPSQSRGHIKVMIGSRKFDTVASVLRYLKQLRAYHGGAIVPVQARARAAPRASHAARHGANRRFATHNPCQGLGAGAADASLAMDAAALYSGAIAPAALVAAAPTPSPDAGAARGPVGAATPFEALAALVALAAHVAAAAQTAIHAHAAPAATAAAAAADKAGVEGPVPAAPAAPAAPASPAAPAAPAATAVAAALGAIVLAPVARRSPNAVIAVRCRGASERVRLGQNAPWYKVLIGASVSLKLDTPLHTLAVVHPVTKKVLRPCNMVSFAADTVALVGDAAASRGTVVDVVTPSPTATYVLAHADAALGNAATALAAASPAAPAAPALRYAVQLLARVVEALALAEREALAASDADQQPAEMMARCGDVLAHTADVVSLTFEVRRAADEAVFADAATAAFAVPLLEAGAAAAPAALAVRLVGPQFSVCWRGRHVYFSLKPDTRLRWVAFVVCCKLQVPVPAHTLAFKHPLTGKLFSPWGNWDGGAQPYASVLAACITDGTVLTMISSADDDDAGAGPAVV